MKTEGNEEMWHKEVTAFIARGSGIILRLRGLPYECTAKEVVEFFQRGEASADVLNGEKGVYFIKKYDGKATGDALVQFGSDDELTAAMSKHKECIGNRYIELFRTHISEVLQVVRRTLEVKNKPQVPRQQLGVGLSQSILHSATARDFIRLRGLPFEAQVHDLLAFLGGYQDNIVYHGVHMVYNHVGQPSGEAVIQMQNETVASLAAAHCNDGFMEVGDKTRRVQVYQCTEKDLEPLLPARPNPVSGLNDGLPPRFLSVFSPNVMEPVCPLAAPHPVNNAGTLMYVVVNPGEPFFPYRSGNEWMPEFPPSPILSQPLLPLQPNDPFISLRDV